MLSGVTTSLINWQSSKDGAALFELQQAYLRHLIQLYSPDRILQISGKPYLVHREVFHYILMQKREEYINAPVPTLQSDISGSLPFRDETFKMIVLAHSHERSDQTAHLIKEVERVLLPEGHAVFFGISQTSLWSLARIFKLFYMPCCDRIYSDFALKSLIKQMGLECIVFPDLQQPYRFNVVQNAFNVVVAKKSVTGWVFGMPLL